MRNKQNRHAHRLCSVVERVRALTNSGTREQNPGFSTDAIDRVGRPNRSALER